jgi:hypothetical protein
MTVKNRKREEILSFEVLDVLFRGLKAGGLGISKLQFLIKKI